MGIAYTGTPLLAGLQNSSKISLDRQGHICTSDSRQTFEIVKYGQCPWQIQPRLRDSLAKNEEKKTLVSDCYAMTPTKHRPTARQTIRNVARTRFIYYRQPNDWI
jgi:hypothetical protein